MNNKGSEDWLEPIERGDWLRTGFHLTQLKRILGYSEAKWKSCLLSQSSLVLVPVNLTAEHRNTPK